MIELFDRGGIMMYPLALTSLIAVAYILERILALRKRKILVPEIISIVENFSTLKDIDLANTVCNKYSGPLPNIVKLGLENHSLPKTELKEIIEDHGRQEARNLDRGLVVLETIAAIAPLMGLLGTVLGMVRVFEVIKDQGIGQTAALSGGISEALLTTVTGLFIGIPVLIAYYFFSNKSQNLIMDIEGYTNDLLLKINRIRTGE